MLCDLNMTYASSPPPHIHHIHRVCHVHRSTTSTRPPCPSPHPHSAASIASRPRVRSSLPTGGDCTVSILALLVHLQPATALRCGALRVLGIIQTYRERENTGDISVIRLKGRRTVELRSSAYPCYPPPMSR